MDIIKSIEHEQLKNKIPELKVGNTVRVHVRIKEGNKERIQVFEGIIIKVQGGGVNQTFTVRKTSYGVGVEKTFLIHSPLVEKVGIYGNVIRFLAPLVITDAQLDAGLDIQHSLHFFRWFHQRIILQFRQIFFVHQMVCQRQLICKFFHRLSLGEVLIRHL